MHTSSSPSSVNVGFSLLSLSDNQRKRTERQQENDLLFVENQLSRRATPVVIAADVLDVLSLDAHFFAVVVVQANEKAGQVCPADDTRPAVEVRCAAETHQPNAELEAQRHTLHHLVGDLVVQGSRRTMRSSLAFQVVHDRIIRR